MTGICAPPSRPHKPAAVAAYPAVHEVVVATDSEATGVGHPTTSRWRLDLTIGSRP